LAQSQETFRSGEKMEDLKNKIGENDFAIKSVKK
jgi:hypothetical protein